MRRVAFLALGCVSLAIAGACEEETEPSPLTERDEFALGVAGILCEGAVSCCGEEQLPEPGEGCNTRMRNETFIAILEAEDDHRTVDLSGAETCIARYRDALESAESCNELPHPSQLVTMCPELFSEIPDGELAPGSNCERVYECKTPEIGDRECRFVNFNQPGICTWRVPVDEGEDCAPSAGVVTVCPEGLGCNPETENGGLVCGAPKAAGEECFAPNSCVDGLGCSAEDQTCQPALALGDPCLTWPDGCEAPEVICSAVSGVCELLPILQQCQNGGCPSPLEAYCDD